MAIIRKTGFMVCVLSILLLFSGCTEKETKIYGKFNDTPNIVLYDNDISFVGDKDKALNLDELLIDSPGHVSTNEVHCVTAEKIYFSYSYYLDENDEKKFWVLSSVNWDGTELETIYKDEFTVSTVIHKRYETVIDKDYSYRNGFFANNKIILSENGKVIEYDINTEKINVYENNYTFPSMGYDAFVSNDKRSVTVTFHDNTQKTINVDYISKNILNKEPELCSIYYVQTCEEKLYLYVLYNQDSLTKNKFYLIEYDFKEDDFENIYSRYWVYDEYELCVVPSVTDQ